MVVPPRRIPQLTIQTRLEVDQARNEDERGLPPSKPGQARVPLHLKVFEILTPVMAEARVMADRPTGALSVAIGAEMRSRTTKRMLTWRAKEKIASKMKRRGFAKKQRGQTYLGYLMERINSCVIQPIYFMIV
jgi:hypothetical protein